MDSDRPQLQTTEKTASSSRLSVSHPETRTPSALAPSQTRQHEEPSTNLEPVSTLLGPRQETSSPTSWPDEKDEKSNGTTSARSHQTHPLPPLPEEISLLVHPDPRVIPLTTRRLSVLPRPDTDWIVPREDRPIRKKSVGERLDPTLLTAISEKEKYAFKAKLTGFALNAAIGLQVLLGALTTGLSVVTSGHQTQVMTAILGGIATVVASYLARARGSNEPELSITRVKDLEQFIRDCEAFKLDHGHVLDSTHDDMLVDFRRRFEDLLGNANGERRLSA